MNLNSGFPSKHRPNRLESYLSIHHTVLQKFYNNGFVGSDDIRIDRRLLGVLMGGCIFCRGGIRITVEKLLQFCDEATYPGCVATSWYAYNVSLESTGNIFRYDNQDQEPWRSGHGDIHHCHRFDWRTGEEISGSPFWVGVHRWPTLGEVIEEAQSWYWEHRQDLPNPDEYARSAPSLEL